MGIRGGSSYSSPNWVRISPLDKKRGEERKAVGTDLGSQVLRAHHTLRMPLTDGSREMIRTVLSTSPTARNRDRCSPGGTLARLMHTTSADISFRSVYSFNCPDYGKKNKIGLCAVIHPVALD